jgi:hypothetical protein
MNHCSAHNFISQSRSERKGRQAATRQYIQYGEEQRRKREAGLKSEYTWRLQRIADIFTCQARPLLFYRHSRLPKMNLKADKSINL